MFSILCLILVSSCRRNKDGCPATFLDKGDDRLTIVNNSSERITFTYGFEYPDDTSYLQTFVRTVPQIDGNPAYNVGPNGTKKFRTNSCWESVFEVSIPSGKLHFVIFNIDSIKAYPAAEIISRGLYKSYLYTLDQLKDNNWRVEYP
ncbi:hypothetical protein A4H97_20955 [Niastella yeongjuensis]|uniref:Uncharacterized protein n=1 Tax=Niastella yeongjuensis TaxID=354355 RepID=A0A1V9FCD9_9BACT|nr:hypothetical protein A4H97_20955 [Niastella yeongjuensis]